MIRFQDTIINPKYFVSAIITKNPCGRYILKILSLQSQATIDTEYSTKASAITALETLYKLLKSKKN
jgi:hypothetical protein